jgi:hypothetical protein
MDKNILYYGVELDKESQDILKQKFGEHEGWRIFCHHMTMVFNTGPDVELTGSERYWYEQNKDKTLFLIVTHFGMDDRVAAVKVMCSAPTRNKHKHITLGVNPEKGGKPVDSNHILKWTLTEPIILVGHVKFWYRKIEKKN